MKKSPDAPAVTREAEEDWGEDTRRKSDIVPLMDFPYLVELALPPEGFRSVPIWDRAQEYPFIYSAQGHAGIEKKPRSAAGQEILTPRGRIHG